MSSSNPAFSRYCQQPQKPQVTVVVSVHPQHLSRFLTEPLNLNSTSLFRLLLFGVFRFSMIYLVCNLTSHCHGDLCLHHLSSSLIRSESHLQTWHIWTGTPQFVEAVRLLISDTLLHVKQIQKLELQEEWPTHISSCTRKCSTEPLSMHWGVKN